MSADWCPDCRERTTINNRGLCAFCDARLVKKPGGWKRPDKRPLFTDPQLTVLYRAYVADRSLSIEELGRRVFEAAGYKSAKSAAVSLSVQWRMRGWPVRGRVEQARLVPKAPAAGARLCAATARSGRPCRKYPRTGSRFCLAHDREATA